MAASTGSLKGPALPGLGGLGAKESAQSGLGCNGCKEGLPSEGQGPLGTIQPASMHKSSTQTVWVKNVQKYGTHFMHRIVCGWAQSCANRN